MATVPPTTKLYDQDFYAWTQEHAALLREGKWQDLDYANLAEEVESLGKSQQREPASCTQELVLHLLTWCYRPEGHQYDDHSWRASMNKQRTALALLFQDNPSIRPRHQAVLDERYPKARKHASTETGLNVRIFPETCPWTLAQILDDDFWPEPPTVV